MQKTSSPLRARRPALGHTSPAPLEKGGGGLDPTFRLALAGVLFVTVLRLLWLSGNPLDLYPDEAQYWIWSQQIDWGYYSKPPLIAWLIAATTSLLGEGDFAIRVSAPILHAMTALVLYGIGVRLYDRSVGLWSALAFITLPSISISAVLISTDVPLLLCWALATYGFVRVVLEKGDPRWWILVALAGGVGLLAKYAMGFWIGSALLYLVMVRDERRHLGRFGLALLGSLLVVAPNLIWNATHGYVTFLHTRDNANVHGFALHPDALALFAGGQFAVFGPVFMATLILILVQTVRGGSAMRAGADRRTLMLLTFSLPTLAVMLVVSLLSRAQPNWAAPAYLSALVLVVGTLHAWRRPGLVAASVILHVVAAVALFGARDAALALGTPIAGRYEPLHRLRGWHTLGRSVSVIARQHPDLAVMGDERELMAALVRYMDPHPFHIIQWNPAHMVRSFFQMTNSLVDQPGGDYLWVTNRVNKDEVLTRFSRTAELAHILVPLGPGLNREVWVYGLYGFKGYAPYGTASAVDGD